MKTCGCDKWQKYIKSIDDALTDDPLREYGDLKYTGNLWGIKIFVHDSVPRDEIWFCETKSGKLEFERKNDKKKPWPSILVSLSSLFSCLGQRY